MPNQYNLNQKKLTIQSIEEAMIILLKDKPLKDIRINELCTRAGVSRMAFYRHFGSIKDVIVQYLKDQQSEFLGRIRLQANFDQTSIGYEYLSLIERDKEFYKSIFDAELQWVLMDFMVEGINFVNSEFLHSVYSDQLQKEYMLSFYAGGYISLFAKWLKHDCRDSKEEILDLMLLHLDYQKPDV